MDSAEERTSAVPETTVERMDTCAILISAKSRGRQLLEATLRLGGFEVVCVDSAKAAVMRLRPDAGPTVILCEATTSEQQVAGIKLLRIVRNLSSVPFIVLTNPTTDQTIFDWLAAGAAYVFTLPFCPNHLVQLQEICFRNTLSSLQITAAPPTPVVALSVQDEQLPASAPQEGLQEPCPVPPKCDAIMQVDTPVAAAPAVARAAPLRVATASAPPSAAPSAAEAPAAKTKAGVAAKRLMKGLKSAVKKVLAQGKKLGGVSSGKPAKADETCVEPSADSDVLLRRIAAASGKGKESSVGEQQLAAQFATDVSVSKASERDLVFREDSAGQLMPRHQQKQLVEQLRMEGVTFPTQ